MLQLVSGQLILDIAKVTEETIFLRCKSSITTYLRTQGVVVLPLQCGIDEVFVGMTPFEHEQLRAIEAEYRVEVDYRLSEETSGIFGGTA